MNDKFDEILQQEEQKEKELQGLKKSVKFDETPLPKTKSTEP